MTWRGNLPINDPVIRPPATARAPASAPSRPFMACRLLLGCGMVAPVLALVSTLLAVTAYPHFNHARQYLSELGGATAARPVIFNAGVFAAGFLAALAGVGFGLAIAALSKSRLVGGLTAAVFLLAGYGLGQAAIFPWPDPRHLAINLGLGIQIAPLLLLWGLWPRRDLVGLKLFLASVFVAMAVLTVLTKHLVLPSLVNDFNVGWWERGYAIILVGWVGVAAFLLDRRLRQESPASKTA